MDYGFENKDKIIGNVTAFVVLLGLCLWGFAYEIINIASLAFKTSELSHAVVVPLAVILLIFLRKDQFRDNLSKGSAWGFVLLAAGVAIHLFTVWPFSYGYAKDLSIVIILAGIVLVSFGWRMLKLFLPVFLLVALSVPVGARLYANLVIRPETFVIKFVAQLLNMVPGLDVFVKGTDMVFYSGRQSGSIALGESNRGARLIFACALIAVFVIFSQKRSNLRIALALLVMIPVIFLVNFVRLLCWSVIQIWFVGDPVSSLPRYISAVFSLLLVWGLFVLVCPFDRKFRDEVVEPQLTDTVVPDRI